MTEYICIYDEDEMQYIPNPYEENTELIRCKNCKLRYASGLCEVLNIVTGDDFFCANGEG